jgi:ribose 5-phosphate isomerase B
MGEKRIIIGSDHFGRLLKDHLKQHLLDLGYEVEDVGVMDDTAVDYPDVAETVAEAIRQGRYQRGMLICGTGIGMAIAANKVPGVRAATCHDPYSAERARKSNDAQIITMGAQIVGPAVAVKLLDIWLESEFQGGRSTPKVEKIKRLEERYLAGN